MSYQTEANGQFHRRWGNPGARSHQPRGSHPDAAPTVFALRCDENNYPILKVIWRRLVRRQKVLLSLAEPPARLGLLGSLCLHCANGVIALPDVAPEIERLGVAADRIVVAHVTPVPQAIVDCGLHRQQAAARRILYMGDLSPRSGVADLQACAIAWAERFPDRDIEIHWMGDGDLRDVLQAQMAPANLHQSFAPLPRQDELAGLVAQYGILAVPSVSDFRSFFVVEAMAAGLPVLGSTRSAQVRALVTAGKTGWTFDPLRGHEMFAAIDAAVTADLEQLSQMRSFARASIRQLFDPDVPVAAERVAA